MEHYLCCTVAADMPCTTAKHSATAYRMVNMSTVGEILLLGSPDNQCKIHCVSVCYWNCKNTLLERKIM